MNRLFYYIIILCLFSLHGTAQWYWEYPMPQGNNLNEISYFNGFDSRGFAVGDKGSILAINPDAEEPTWELMDSVVNVNLFDISLRNTNKGLIVGNHGTILELNPDFTWNKMVSNTFYSLRGVTWVNDNKAVAVGSDGIILSYKNDTWLPINTGAYNSLNSVFFTNENVGIAAGFTGSIMRTEDGGDNWNLYIPDSTLVFNDIHFPSEDVGYIVGNKGIIVKTENGGLSWNKISPDTIIFNYNSVLFFNDTIGYIAGDNGQVYYTRDGGKIWNKNLPFVNMRINSIYHTNANSTVAEIIVCGENGIMLESQNWGDWDNITNASFQNLISIKLYNDTSRLAFGGYPYTNSPFILRYHYITDSIFEGNDTIIERNLGWEEDTANFTNIKHYITDVYYNYEYKQGFMSGNNGGFYILHEDDSCTQIIPGTPRSLYAVSAYYENDTAAVFLAGAFGTIVKATDLGEHTEILETNTENHLFGIVMPGLEDDGYAVGDNGTLLRIRNEGYSMQKIPTGISSAFYDIELISQTKGFMVGAYGIIAKFEIINDQYVFKVITSGVATPLVDIYFQDDLTGYIVGDKGTILKTVDGGETWNKLYSPTNNHLKGIAFADNDLGYVCGYGSTILLTENAGGGFIPTPNVNETSETQFDFSIYPNPAANEISLSYELSNKSSVEISIFDLSGRLVQQVLKEIQNTGEQNFSHNINHLEKGIYLVSLQVNQQVSSKKMVILK